MAKHFLLLLLYFLVGNACAPKGTTALYLKARRKHVSHLFQPQECAEEQCIEGELPEPKELQLRLLLDRLNEEDYITDQVTMDKRVPLLPGEEVFADTNSVPCFCHSSRFRSRDLGPHYYPRYLSEKMCENSLCGGDSVYCCTPLYHTILVLKNETSADIKDSRLPGFLRSQWKFEEVNITVSCVCEIKSFHG